MEMSVAKNPVVLGPSGMSSLLIGLRASCASRSALSYTVGSPGRHIGATLYTMVAVYGATISG